MIRRATNDDIETVRNLVFDALEEFGLRSDPTGIDADLQDIEKSYWERGGSFYVMIDSNETIVGSVALYPLGNCDYELRKMYLGSSVRGKGNGKALLEHALGQAKRMGAARLFLETADVLQVAKRLYRKYGFKPCETGHLSARCDQAYVKVLDEL